jgi:integrase
VLTLHLENINLEERWIEVHPEGAKNRFRVRKLELNDEAFAAVVEALERAKQLGANQPSHYLFPFRVTRRNYYDPTRRQRDIKTAWSSLRKAAGLPHLRPYDLRHTVATRLLKDPKVSTKSAIDICGWISPQMIKKYGHQDSDTRREALDRLNRKTERVIKQLAKEEKKPNETVDVAKALTAAVEMLAKLVKQQG